MSPHFFAHIIHILESIEIIAEYLGDSKNGLENVKTYDAVLRRVQTLSESASKLPIDIKQSYPEVKWQEFSEMRNAIAHDYLGDIYYENLSKFIDNQISVLRTAMQKQLPEWKELRARLKSD